MNTELTERYARALHAMQAGVAFMMNFPSPEIMPKHLRVGINAAMCDHAALAKLLIAKGIITEDEYLLSLAEAMEAEVERYRQSIAERTGVKPEEAIEGEGFHIDMTWVSESKKALKWTDDTFKTFLASQYMVSPQGTLEDVIKRLTREQAEEFVKEINSRLENQPGLFE
ncbi:hypothetical protein LCGC14_0262170 [marine sediment metagenome]|uniref:Uncharacterized protein n=1 Tax=marine sediment metagenome TaxID=412755 RepID=A0A0F9X5V0_9ZZZZ